MLLKLCHFFLGGVDVTVSQKLGQVAGEEGIELHEEVVDSNSKVEVKLFGGQPCQDSGGCVREREKGKDINSLQCIQEIGSISIQ